MTDTLKDMKAFPPYIDAYIEQRDDGQGVTFDKFCSCLQSLACDYGEQSIGRSMLNGDGPLLAGDDFVMAVGRWGGDSYACIGRQRHETTVVPFDYPEEWDVT